MGSIQKSISLKNCTIDPSDWTVTEYKKDDSSTYNLLDILKQFADLDGVSITISRADKLPTVGGGAE